MASLPPALRSSEEAQDFICHLISNFPDKRDRLPTLNAFARTSKLWLPSGLRSLYRASLEAPSFDRKADPATTWSSATSLLTTLQARPGLASHVEWLQPLVNIYKRLSNSPTLHHLQLPPVTGDDVVLENDPADSTLWKWAHDVVSCCRRLKNVGMPMATEWDRPTTTGTTAATRGGLSIRLRRLELYRCDLDIEDLLLYLPKYTANFHFFTMTSRRNLPSSPLDNVVQALGQRLRVFFFDALNTIQQEPWEFDADDHSGPIIPLSLFTSFPPLRNLTLRYTRGMTLEKLEALAKACPGLVTINFAESAWSVPYAALPGCDGRVARVINSLESLEVLDLGWILVESLWESDVAARAKGVMLEYVLFEEEEEEEEGGGDTDLELLDHDEYDSDFY